MGEVFGKNLRFLMESKSVTQSYLATVLDVDESTIANWEKGTEEPDLERLIKLSEFFVVSLDDLLKCDLSASRKNKRQIFESILNNVYDGIIIFDKNMDVIEMNDMARSYTFINFNNSGNLNEIYKDVELYDNEGNLVTHDNFIFNKVIRYKEFIKEKYTIRYDKGYVNRESCGIPIFNQDGSLAAGILIIRNIPDKFVQKTNLDVTSQFSTLNKIIDNLDLCFVRFSYPQLEVIEINNKAYNLIQQISNNVGTQLTIQGLNIYAFIPPKKNKLDLILDTINNNDCYYDIQKYLISGKEIYYKYIYQPLYGSNDEIIEVIVLGMDVTKDVKSRKKMEKALKIQDEIYSNVSHELKTPLSVIFSANQMIDMFLKKSFEDNKEKIFNYNNIIKQNCYRLMKLINNIVDTSKSNSGNFTLNLRNINIVEVVENIVESVTEYVKSRKLKIIFDTNVEEKIIACDPMQIERIMLNLISNAIKFSDPDNEILVTVLDKGDKVEISVKDEGIGIEPKHLAHIFQRYYQVDKSLNRNAEGCGIGLSLLKSIVELHGGKIYVKSKVNEGSTFIVELPSKLVEDNDDLNKVDYKNNKIEMIRVEFSDIYNI